MVGNLSAVMPNMLCCVNQVVKLIFFNLDTIEQSQLKLYL